MVLKKKVILAFTLKLLFSVSILQAQGKNFAKHDSANMRPVYTSISFMKQPVYQNQVTGNFYAKQLPFFCNKELQFQKSTGIAFKFRLGSVEYCDKLEGKHR